MSFDIEKVREQRRGDKSVKIAALNAKSWSPPEVTATGLPTTKLGKESLLAKHVRS